MGPLCLCVVALIWGTTFAVTKDAVSTVPPSALIVARFLIAAVVTVPFLRRGSGLLLAGLELGAVLWLGYFTQAKGLVVTSVGRSAFITALSVVIVPLVAALLGRRLGLATWLAALLALAGVGLLTYDRGPPNSGDAWTMVTAAAYAVYILRLEVHAPRHEARALTAAQMWGVVIFAAAWGAIELTVGQGYNPDLIRTALVPAVYLGLAATALTTWLQSVGQREVSAPQAAVIYSSEPVWAAVFAFVLLGERLGILGLAGALAVMAAMLIGQLRGAGDQRCGHAR